MEKIANKERMKKVNLEEERMKKENCGNRMDE